MAASTSNGGKALPRSGSSAVSPQAPHRRGRAAEAPPGSHGTRFCLRTSPPAGPQERLGQPVERLCRTPTHRGPTPAFQARVRTGALGRGVATWTRARSHTRALAHTQAVDARQQGGGTPVPERVEAILGRTPRDFLSPALGTSLSEHLLSPNHNSSPTRLHATRRPAAPEEHGQQGGDRQPCCRPAPRDTSPRYLVFNDDAIGQRHTLPGLSGPY